MYDSASPGTHYEDQAGLELTDICLPLSPRIMLKGLCHYSSQGMFLLIFVTIGCASTICVWEGTCVPRHACADQRTTLWILEVEFRPSCSRSLPVETSVGPGILFIPKSMTL